MSLTATRHVSVAGVAAVGRPSYQLPDGPSDRLPGIPRGIAHRGAPVRDVGDNGDAGRTDGGGGGGGENTLPAFARAAALGLDLETDVRASADGVAVLHHDPVLARTTGDPRRVGAVAWRELARLRVGSGSGGSGTGAGPTTAGGAPLARLDELLDALPGVQVNVDVKDRAGIAATVAAVRRAGGSRGRAGRVTVASFSSWRADRVRRALGHAVGWSATPPEIAALVALSRTAPDGRARPAARALAATVARQLDAIQVPVRLLAGHHGQALIDCCHDLGVQVHVWTVDEPSEIRALFDRGVDAVISDDAEALAGVLAGVLAELPAPLPRRTEAAPGVPGW